MRMPPASVVEAFDVVKDVRPGVGSGAIATPVHTFAFEQAKETFCHGVVVATAHVAHAAHDAVIGEEPLILLAGVLRPAIRVQDDGPIAVPLPQRHEHGLHDELSR